MMTTFLLFDFVGKIISGFSWANRYFSLKGLLIFALLRLICTSLFLMEALPLYKCENGLCTGKGPIIKIDTISIFTMLMFALLNGWIGSVIMMKFTTVIKKQIDYRNGGNI